MKAKDLIIKVIRADVAKAIIKKFHYSGKSTNNSQIHFGVFIGGKLEGALQFGPPIDKRKLLPLVKNTKWGQMLELNRMAFGPLLPKNSESRAIAICMKLIKRHYPHIKWIVSFADGTQCGDGTIYRASGFHLIGINKNSSLWEMPDGEIAMNHGTSKKMKELKTKVVSKTSMTKGKHILKDGKASMNSLREMGAKPLPGYQIKYIYFLHREELANLTVPTLPFSDIQKKGAGMYKGIKREK